MGDDLKPCPFCGETLEVRGGVNPYGRHADKDSTCIMAGRAITIPFDIERWNTRALERLSRPTQSSGEPFGWFIHTGEEGIGGHTETERRHAEQAEREGMKITPLYASPSIPADNGVRVKPLEWSQSRVFGMTKRRGSGVMGEWTAFVVDDLTPDQIAAKEAEAQTAYEAHVRAWLETASPISRNGGSE
jgi:hypothetical protein